MAEGSEKVPIARAGPEDVEQCLPPVSASRVGWGGRWIGMGHRGKGTGGFGWGSRGHGWVFVCGNLGVLGPNPAPRSPRQAYAAVSPPGPGRLLKAGAAVLIAGALLLLAGAIGAFYFWKATERQVRAGGGTAAHRGGLGGWWWWWWEDGDTPYEVDEEGLKESFWGFSSMLSLKKKKKKIQPKNQPHARYLDRLFGRSLVEARLLTNAKRSFESTDTTLISALKSSANSNPNKSPGIHILGKLQLPGQKKH